MSRSPRTVYVALVLVVLAALLAWWWKRPDRTATVDRGDSTTPTPGTPRIPQPRQPAAASTPARAPIPLLPAVSGPDPDATHGAFAGRVINWGDGRGVAGAEVVFSRGDDGVTVTTGADGRFELTPPALGTYKLAVASADGYLPFAPAWNDSPIELVARAHTRVEGIVVYLSPAIDYTGVVLDKTGKPVEGAAVELIGARSGSTTLLPIDDQFTSGKDGSFTFHAPDFAMLEARHDCCEPGRAVLDGAAQVSHRLEIRLGQGPDRPHPPQPRERGTARIRGVVRAGGKAVPAFTVAVIVADGLRNNVVEVGSFFDGEGRFEIGGLAAADYVVRVMAHGYARSQPVPATASEDPGEVTVELPRGGTLVGTVIDRETRKPLELARVSVEGAVGDAGGTVPTTASTVTSADGSFELAGLPLGRVSVVAAAFEHNSRIIGGLDVTDGARLGPIEIDLSPVADGARPQLELAGIGAALRAAVDGLEVQRLFEGGGAIDAGIVVGDVIVAVDGKRVTELGFNDAIQEIRGIEGTTVTLTLRRDGGEVDVITTRKKIRA